MPLPYAFQIHACDFPKGKTFAQVQADLRAIGYAVEWQFPRIVAVRMH